MHVAARAVLLHCRAPGLVGYLLRGRVALALGPQLLLCGAEGGRVLHGLLLRDFTLGTGDIRHLHADFRDKLRLL